MKKILVVSLILIPMMASAKVEDFNAMIKENISEQQQLHKDVEQGMDQGRVALEATRDRGTIAETVHEQTNVPTNPKLLRFKKEIVSHNGSDKADQKRLANEFKSADMEF